MESMWRWLYRKFGARYLLAYAVFATFAAFVITLGTIGIFSLYQEHTKEEFWRVWAFTDACVLLSLGSALLRLRREVEPIVGWMRGGRDERSSMEAWRCAIALPLRFVTRGSWQPALFVALPVSIYATWELQLPFYSAAFIFAGAMVAIMYAAILQFFYSEVALRPVVTDISRYLPT